MRVGVVGAGIGGLALTHYLRERGVEVVTVEAGDEPGGVIRSRRVDGRLLEYGPQRLRRTDPVEELVADLGIGDEILTAPEAPIYVYRDGRLREVPRSIRGFLRTDLLSLRGKLRVLAEPLSDPATGDERAADLFARKFGPEAARYLLGPLFGGIYASDPAEMPAKYALSGLLRAEEKHGSLLRAALSRAGGDRSPPISFGDGLQRLPEALYDEHEAAVRLSTPVERIVADDGTDGNADGYRLVTADGEERVDHVVVTTPAPAAADLLEEVAPDAADAFAALNYNPLAMVHLRADVAPEGFGYKHVPGDRFRVRGVTWNASLFGRDGVHTAFLGGMEDPEVVEEDDETIGEIATREFEAVMDEPAEVLDVTRLRAYPAYDTSWAAIEDLDLPEGIDLVTNYTGRIGVPSRIREARRVSERLAEEGETQRTKPA